MAVYTCLYYDLVIFTRLSDTKTATFPHYLYLSITYMLQRGIFVNDFGGLKLQPLQPFRLFLGVFPVVQIASSDVLTLGFQNCMMRCLYSEDRHARRDYGFHRPYAGGGMRSEWSDN